MPFSARGSHRHAQPQRQRSPGAAAATSAETAQDDAFACFLFKSAKSLLKITD